MVPSCLHHKSIWNAPHEKNFSLAIGPASMTFFAWADTVLSPSLSWVPPAQLRPWKMHRAQSHILWILEFTDLQVCKFSMYNIWYVSVCLHKYMWLYNIIYAYMVNYFHVPWWIKWKHSSNSTVLCKIMPNLSQRPRSSFFSSVQPQAPRGDQWPSSTARSIEIHRYGLSGVFRCWSSRKLARDPYW